MPFQFLLETDHRMVMSPAVIIMHIDAVSYTHLTLPTICSV